MSNLLDNEGFLVLHLCHQEGGHHGDDQKGKEKCACHGKDVGERHWLKQLSLQSFQGKERDKHNTNNDGSRNDGGHHFTHGPENHVKTG